MDLLWHSAASRTTSKASWDSLSKSGPERPEELRGLRSKSDAARGAAFWEDKLDIKSSDLKSLKRTRAPVRAIWEGSKRKGLFHSQRIIRYRKKNPHGYADSWGLCCKHQTHCLTLRGAAGWNLSPTCEIPTWFIKPAYSIKHRQCASPRIL